MIRVSEHWTTPLTLAMLDLKTNQLPVCPRPNPWSWASQQFSGKQAAVPVPRSPGCIIFWYSFRLKKKEVSSESKKSYLSSIHKLQDGIQMSEWYILGRRCQCLYILKINSWQPSRWWWDAWRGSDPADSWSRGSRRIRSSCGLWCVDPGGFDERYVKWSTKALDSRTIQSP